MEKEREKVLNQVESVARNVNSKLEELVNHATNKFKEIEKGIDGRLNGYNIVKGAFDKQDNDMASIL